MLRPALLLIDRLRTGSRLGLLVSVLVLPGLLATWAFTGAMNSQIDFSSSERAGVQVLRPALEVLQQAAAGDEPDLAGLQAAADEHPDLALTDAIDAVAQADGRIATTSAAVDLITELGNTSKLILDPDLDSFYVMDSLVVQLPKAALAAARASEPERGTLAQRVANQAVRAGELAGTSGALESDLKTAVENTAATGLGEQLAGLTAVQEETKALAKRLTDTLDAPTPGDPTATIAAIGQAVGPTADALDQLLAVRVEGLTSERDRTLLITAIGFLLAAWLAASVVWRTRRDVRQTMDAVAAIAVNDFGERPLPEGGDELGDIGRSISLARVKLAAQAEDLQHAQRARESQMHESFLHQRGSEAQARQRAQQVIDETSVGVISELQTVVGQVDAVRGAAGTIDDRVSSANAVTREVVQQAQAADQVLDELTDSLRQVSGMARLIAGIADQTRMLALNATIEAARAGEAGRGFSVVAGEVKHLAFTTAQSTGEITSIIGSVENQVAAMAVAIASMSQGIGGVDSATGDLHMVASEQRELVQQLDQSVSEAIARIEGMSKLTDALERRRTDRVPLFGAVTLRLGAREVIGRLYDISEQGLGCTVDQHEILLLDTLIEMEFELDGRAVVVPGTINTSRPDNGKTRLGLEFTEMEEGPLLRIGAYIDATLNATA